MEVEYALAIFRRRIGPWRATTDEAREDAVRTGNGSRDRESETIYLTVPADIISRAVDRKAVQPRLRIVGR
jgi:hypothetical protein